MEWCVLIKIIRIKIIVWNIISLGNSKLQINFWKSFSALCNGTQALFYLSWFYNGFIICINDHLDSFYLQADGVVKLITRNGQYINISRPYNKLSPISYSIFIIHFTAAVSNSLLYVLPNITSSSWKNE